MKRLHTLLPLLLLSLPLAACTDKGEDAVSAAAETTSSVGRTVKEATDKARKEIVLGNISLSGEGANRGEITPEGKLLIGGTEVTTTEAQRAQLLAYRKQLEAIAMAGMDVGVAGAQLGVAAAGEALKGIFSGKTDEIEQRINAEADKIKAQAMTICEKMPAMMAAQQALAVSLPAFKPYATMDQSDIDDCGK